MTSNISDSIRYVGVDDTGISFFENQYPVSHGMSYNSYLIIDEKVAVTDTVDRNFGAEWLSNIASALEGRSPDFLIVHHMEPDHSANILAALHRYPDMKIVASAKAISMLPLYFEDFDFTGRTIAVKEGDILTLGAHKLIFFSAPMVHWPEVMISCELSEKVLFSADAFGKFGALCYDDEWLPEARRYYANIVGKYGPQVQALFKKIAGAEIKAIAPLHGPVLNERLEEYLSHYNRWSTYEPEIPDGVLVAYASIYGGTAEAALLLAQMLREAGAPEVVAFDLCRHDQAEAVAQAFRLGRIVLAAPTYDAGIFPAMHNFIYHLQIKGVRNRRFALIENGSWAPVAALQMKEMLSHLKNSEVVDPVLTVRGRLHTADRDTLRAITASLLA